MKRSPAARARAELELRRREAEADLLEYRDDPIGFQRDYLGRTLWSKQSEVAVAIAENPITVVPAGRAVGKSFLLAGVVLWFLYTRPNSLVITTGPDHRQVVSVLWKEIRRALAANRGAAKRLRYDHISAGYGSPQRLVVQDGTEWGAIGFACKSSEGLSGQHNKDMLMVIDEASGVEKFVWESIFGAAATRYVIVGNPLRYDCHFRELFDLAESGSPDMAAVTISSLEHPDANLEVSPIGAVSASWLRQQRAIHGEGSAWWAANIQGQFPDQQFDRLIPAAWLNATSDVRILEDEQWQDCPDGAAFMGVDIGGGVNADLSVITVRTRKRLLEIFASGDHGVLDDAKHRLEPVVIEMAKRWSVSPDRCVFDKGGIGRSFSSYLANYGFEGAVGFFGSGSGGRLHANRRTANAFAVKRRFDPHTEGFVPFYTGGVLGWDKLRYELGELKTEMTLEEGIVKEKLEDKSAMMERIHGSPDYVDSFLMTFTYTT